MKNYKNYIVSIKDDCCVNYGDKIPNDTSSLPNELKKVYEDFIDFHRNKFKELHNAYNFENEFLDFYKGEVKAESILKIGAYSKIIGGFGMSNSEYVIARNETKNTLKIKDKTKKSYFSLFPDEIVIIAYGEVLGAYNSTDGYIGRNDVLLENFESLYLNSPNVQKIANDSGYAYEGSKLIRNKYCLDYIAEQILNNFYNTDVAIKFCCAYKEKLNEYHFDAFFHSSDELCSNLCYILFIDISIDKRPYIDYILNSDNTSSQIVLTRWVEQLSFDDIKKLLNQAITVDRALATKVTQLSHLSVTEREFIFNELVKCNDAKVKKNLLRAVLVFTIKKKSLKIADING